MKCRRFAAPTQFPICNVIIIVVSNSCALLFTETFLTTSSIKWQANFPSNWSKIVKQSDYKTDLQTIFSISGIQVENHFTYPFFFSASSMTYHKIKPVFAFMLPLQRLSQKT